VSEVEINFGENKKEWNYESSKFFHTLVKNLETARWATNGKEIAIKHDDTIYFDLESGQLVYYTT
jgi:hypothetical protein